MFTGSLVVRPARYTPEKGLHHADNTDVHHIWALLGGYAKERLLLPRTAEDIQEKIGNFRIAEHSSAASLFATTVIRCTKSAHSRLFPNMSVRASAPKSSRASFGR